MSLNNCSKENKRFYDVLSYLNLNIALVYFEFLAEKNVRHRFNLPLTIAIANSCRNCLPLLSLSHLCLQGIGKNQNKKVSYDKCTNVCEFEAKPSDLTLNLLTDSSDL